MDMIGRNLLLLMIAVAPTLDCSRVMTTSTPSSKALSARREVDEANILEMSDDNLQKRKSRCEIHGDRLIEDIVPIEYGLRFVDHEDLEASMLFPNAHEVLEGGCIVGPQTYARVKFCPSCRAQKKRWLLEHSGAGVSDGIDGGVRGASSAVTR